MNQFISERVTVHRDATTGRLRAFVWRGHTFTVVEWLSQDRYVDFQPRWWLRRHRRRIVVRTEEDRYFELYTERPGEWILYRELDDPFA
jgi:hypothetical protein